MSHRFDIAQLERLVRKAGDLAMSRFKKPLKIDYKKNGSPVSDADLEIEGLLLDGFRALDDELAILSEETSHPQDSDLSNYVVIDPIDGTRAFINGREDWCVAVAYVHDHQPTLAAVYQPSQNRMLTASKSHGAFLNGTRLGGEHKKRAFRYSAPSQKSQLSDIAQLSLGHDRELESEFVRINSLALRIVAVATGEIDLSLSSPGAQQWDVAAAQLILHEAGGTMRELHTNGDITPIEYRLPSQPLLGLIAAKSIEAVTIVTDHLINKTDIIRKR